MGIKNFNVIFGSYIDIFTTDHIKESDVEFKVVIDGDLLLHKGIHKDVVDPCEVGFNSFNYLQRILKNIKEKCKVSSSWIYFDGVSPNMKRGVQIKRKRNSYKVNIKQAMDAFIKLCEESEIIVHKLNFGESEIEMVLENFETTPLILVTTDTDVYNVCYNRCTHPLYMYKDGKFVNLKKFHINKLSRNTISVIITLMGTDYSQTLLTPTMINAILFCSKNHYSSSFDNIDKLDLSNPDEWKDALVYLFDIIEYAEFILKFKINYGQRRKLLLSETKTNLTLDKIETVLNCFAWMFDYFKIGKKVNHFLNNYNSYVELKNEDQIRMIKQFKGEKKKNPTKFSKVEESEKKSPSILENYKFEF